MSRCSCLYLSVLFTAFFCLTSANAAEPLSFDPVAEADREYSELTAELERKDWYAGIADQTYAPSALILDSDSDPTIVVLRRTGALLNDIRDMSDVPNLDAEIEALLSLLNEEKRISVDDESARRELFNRVLNLRRRIALKNPLLSFDRIVFVKRRLPPLNHMCDQFFGCFATPGGGLFILNDPFSDSPSIEDLMAEASVENGRLQSERLEGGAFLSPTLSYDGGTITFSYSECGLDTPNPSPRRWFKEAEWTPELSYHVFSINADGTGLRQVTDGSWNDLHPFYLPDGRIVFTSERRGGFGRCHARPVPIYTLHGMNADGSDIVRLSHHESNEWYPSVNRDGMIVYTRWDYVDRGFNQAHHPWITTPDGRDPRIIQGNYKEVHDDAPNMEMNVLAIPGSQKYVAVAAAHHQVTFGSLITIDPAVPDDNAMSAVRRVTPDNGFPETEEKGTLKYGTPWPLSEKYYLCSMMNGPSYGLYLLDAFGNRELLYRDADFHCTTPLPLRAREAPPLIPAQGEPVRLVERPLFRRIGEEHAIDPECPGMTEPATVSLVNVYDSLFPFPEETKITQLRILHVPPKSVSNHHDPQVGYGCETGARTVLGTVPVEEDGSANFYLPPAKSVYFQAIDERGLAVQSMRSATYVHGGEQLVCAGCHETKGRTPLSSVESFPLAFMREPSALASEVEGSHPFSYPRLVQPVLDRYCVECHEASEDPGAFSLAKGNWKQDPFRWHDSYRNLHPYAFHFGARIQTGYDGWAPARTIPGKFGAQASRLFAILEAGHYDVKLPPEELRRITLWLDANSDFFGSYENIDAQADGQLIYATID